jgi:hypothetical protein
MYSYTGSAAIVKLSVQFVQFEWEEAFVKVRGTTDVYVRTSSMYDEELLSNLRMQRSMCREPRSC